MLWNSLCISFLSVFNLAACSWSKRNITFQISTLSNYLKLHHWECRMVCRVGVGFSIPVQWHELVCGSPGQCKDHLSDLYRHESWTIKKAECWRLDALKLWCWRRPLRVLWTSRRSNQSILKEISPEYSQEGMMLKLKLWPPDLRSWLNGKNLEVRKDWGQEEKRETEDEMVGKHQWLNGHEFEQTLGVNNKENLACCTPWGPKESDMP